MEPEVSVCLVSGFPLCSGYCIGPAAFLYPDRAAQWSVRSRSEAALGELCRRKM
ncbi:MAG: hypothetical protein J6A08_02880 [Lachnospiraceae bacterium]|nr:hypothetical protein [Lachnospiraceae bacterium]